MNVAVLIALGIIISLIIAFEAGSYAASAEPEYFTGDLLDVLKRAKWRQISLKCDPIEHVRVIHPPYNWAEETD